MKMFLLTLVAFALILGMNEPAMPVDWVAQVSGGEDYQEFITLTVVTFAIDPDEPIDIVEMELIEEENPQFFLAQFEPDLLAEHWKVIASPPELVSPSVLFDGDDINRNGVNELDDPPFLYVGPLR